MRIHNLYVDASGETHFRDIEVEWVEERRGSKLSKRLPATGIIFRETQAEHDVDWHSAPRRQYIINLDAGVKITASDGESRVIGVGEVILSDNEYRTAVRLKKAYWLYAVFNCASKPRAHVVQDPARLGWEPLVKIEHYHLGADAIRQASGAC